MRYTTPFLEIIYCNDDDIITSSPGRYDNFGSDIEDWFDD